MGGGERRTALVTGAAKRLGQALALRLAEEGFDVAVHYRGSEEAARRTAAQLRERGAAAEVFRADLSEPDAPRDLIAAVVETFGRLDVLVNSAASFLSRPLAESDAALWDRVFPVNLRAPALLTASAAPHLAHAASGGGPAGLVVNMVDLSALYPWRGYAVHGAVKAGLLQLTRTAALELAPSVRVNAIVPGPILPPPGVAEESEAWRRTGERIPLGRPGDPANVAAALSYLLTNDFVTGDVLSVDGGEHLLGSTKR
jgi:NAD(P)-dependent dehydrogenase (short-subunit alcohol dehydrogenase family)